MIALRDFHWGERIIIERMILSRPTYDTDFELLSQNEQAAVMALMSHENITSSVPTHDSLAEEPESLLDAKFDLNAIRCESSQPGQSISGLFIHISRCNHECQPNAQLYYLPQQRVQVLIACKPHIRQGEEITISYIKINHEDDTVALFILREKWKFVCQCLACRDQEVRWKMKEVSRYQRDMIALTKQHKFEDAMTTGETILSLYQELACYSPAWYWKTYYELFQIAAIQSSTLSRTLQYIEKAMTLVVAYVRQTNASGERLLIWPPNNELYSVATVQCGVDEEALSRDMQLLVPVDGMKIKRYFDDPSSYPFYCWRPASPEASNDESSTSSSKSNTGSEDVEIVRDKLLYDNGNK
jgi:hypothetical protein